MPRCRSGVLEMMSERVGLQGDVGKKPGGRSCLRLQVGARSARPLLLLLQ